MKRKPCTKRRYATVGEARHAIAAMASRFGFVFKRPYRCGRCRAFHITSTPPIGTRRKQW
ncbi:MAG: hypothetical protein HOQ03_04395 [Thermoleophilia bacterium]|nr:hypothetical protein [Thermoleophilia bacterium]